MEYLKRILKEKRIADIYLTGFVDVEDGMAQFCHDLRVIYFEVDSNYIEFEAINQFSKLKISIVDSIQHKYEIDEDMIRAKSSIGEIVLRDTMANDNHIDSIIFYNLEEQEGICDAVEIKLGNGQILFLDPTYYFGINIGGKEQKEAWQINLKENENLRETRINISDRK